MVRVIRLYNVSNSEVIGKSNQMEFWIIREIAINLGRVTSYVLLLIVGILNSNTAMGIVMIILSLVIYWFGSILQKIEKV